MLKLKDDQKLDLDSKERLLPDEEATGHIFSNHEIPAEALKGRCPWE